jgi:hypothetical protein
MKRIIPSVTSFFNLGFVGFPFAEGMLVPLPTNPEKDFVFSESLNLGLWKKD